MGTQQDAAAANANPSGTIKTSVSIYFPILGVGLILFECLRKRFRRAYDTREEDVFRVPSTSTGLFRWAFAGFRVSDDEILQRCGLDTLTFLRFLRLGQKLALLAIGCSIILFPLYATAPAHRVSIDPLARVSMSNLPERSDRLWASTVVAFVMAIYAMRLLVQEYKQYVRCRHEVLGRMEAPQYSVLINDLPLHLRTHQTLEKYLSKIFPSSIRNVYVALECATLETLVDRREQVRGDLEHALAKCEQSRKRPQHREGRSYIGMLMCKTGSRGYQVESIDHYQDQLATLNEEVAREIQSIDDAQAQLAIQVEEQECEMGSFDDSDELELPQLEGRWAKVMKKPTLGEDPKQTPLLDCRGHAEKLSSSFGSEEEEEDIDEQKARRDEREMSQEEREQVRKDRPIRVMRRAAFVSFTSLMSAQVAQQSLQAKDPAFMGVLPAPHANDINWDNIGLHSRTRAFGKLISSLISATIVLFWTIPTAFVASLATVESLRRALPFLNKAFDEYPILQDIFKQIAPLALVLLSALAPIVFNFLSGREGHPSNTEVRAALFTKLAYFQLVQIFFVTVIVGTILDSLKEILDQPKKLVSMLGRSMPQQSTFFISYVIVQTGLGLVMELLRVVPLVLSCLYALLAPKHTRRERNSPWLGLRDIAQSDPFDPTNPLADCFLVLLVTLTFAPIAPLVCYFTWFFFFMAEIVYRRQVLYVYKPMCFALGAYWPRIFKFCIIALVVAQLTLIGILSLKKAAVPPICIIVLIAIVLLFNYHVLSLYPAVAKYLPLRECVRLDSVRGLRDPTAPVFFFLDNVYRQPAMNQRVPIRADYRMLVNDYSVDTALTSPESYATEDQNLFTTVWAALSCASNGIREPVVQSHPLCLVSRPAVY
ncbi:CSC1-like protein [Phytophthora citrophthora]|uniref:CSC1-like protein n=1 Tax=Phytophthora citrophthora TaxID=4793 RepID=A0AAD9LLL2_9STRA|nr:CSC1-like protein [Phytophthora citrophthora]